jgi:predicted dehydrogenase
LVTDRVAADAFQGRDIRAALIGYGISGAVFHAPFLTTTPGLTLSVIVTSDAARRRQPALDHPVTRLMATADDLWRSAADVDLVVVGSPNVAHVPQARAALEAGLAVVIEKPMAATAAEGRDLVALARARGRLLTVFHNRRWDGDFLTVRRLLDEGRIGRPLRFESRFDRWRPAPRGGWRERAAPDLAGGLTYDLGSHLVDQALQLFGPVRDVYCEQDVRRAGADADDDSFLALTHASGVRSHLYMSVMNAQPGLRFRLFGTDGTYVKDGLDVQEDALRRGERPDRPGWGTEPADRWGRLATNDGVRTIETEPGAYQHFYAGLAAALRHGAPPPVDPDSAVAVLEVLDRARASAAARR